MNSKAAIAILVLFLGVGGAISYDQITASQDTGSAVVEEFTYGKEDESQEGTEVMMYFYAVETYDKVLVPLAYASEVITDEDINQFVLLTETVIPRMELAEIDKGVDIVMSHANMNRKYPVWIEVIRVSD